MICRLSIVVLGLACTVAPCAAGPPRGSEAAEKKEPTILRLLSNSKPFFYSEAALDLLLRDDSNAARTILDVSADEVEQIRRSVDGQLTFLELRTKSPALFDQEGCVRQVPGQFSERTNHILQAEELVQRARLPLPELARRADHAIVVEIVEVTPGLLSGSFGSVVRARVDEVLGWRSDALEVGDEFLYRSEFVDVQLGGARFCAKNSQYFFPEPGTKALVLSPALNARFGVFFPYAEFHLAGSLIEVHPYSFVQLEPETVLLSDLRRELAR